MQTTLIDIDFLKENPDNPRTITDAKFAQLVASVKQFPQMLEVRHNSLPYRWKVVKYNKTKKY